MDTVVFMGEKGIEYFSNEVILARIHGEEDSVTAKALFVSGYPTSILFDKNGEEIDRIVGYAPTEEFLGMINDYRNGIGTLADLLGRSETEVDKDLYFEIADKYRYRGAPDDAELWFTKVIGTGDPLDSLSGESRMALALMLRRAEQYDEALEAFGQVAKDFEGQSFGMQAHIWKAIVHRSAGDTVKAIEGFEAYINMFPESEDVAYAKGQIAKLNGAGQATE